ncbi:glycine-rich domain-containing protein [Glycomyces sp. MUSA5-2]|uniref:glycine-rich domain-containing protein n=1 Tax=Glycomyces sp. MUSA5-2 TaxID=2053002 RepID=UPI00300A2DA4
MDTTKALKRGRDLVSEEVFAKLAKRIADEHHFETEMAERCLDQGLAFLGACAVSTAPLSPSMAADIGWHTFILYTRDYAAFCEAVAGRFLHHVPDETEGTAAEEDVQTVLDRSAAAIRKAGYQVDRELWQYEGALKCSQCHNGCAEDPPPVPPFIPGQGPGAN